MTVKITFKPHPDENIEWHYLVKFAEETEGNLRITDGEGSNQYIPLALIERWGAADTSL